MNSFAAVNKSLKREESIVKHKEDMNTKLPDLTSGFTQMNSTTENFNKLKMHSPTKER